MADLQSQDYIRRSATTMTPPSIRDHEQEVAKLIDVSRCIGCKACQSACMEWNNLRPEMGYFEGSYDNPLDLGPSAWTVMRFTEWEDEKGNLEWLIRKDGCMHCEDPGCLKACPSPGAIVQYANGIVDFISENCTGLRQGVPDRRDHVWLEDRHDHMGRRAHRGPQGTRLRQCRSV